MSQAGRRLATGGWGTEISTGSGLWAVSCRSEKKRAASAAGSHCSANLFFTLARAYSLEPRAFSVAPSACALGALQ